MRHLPFPTVEYDDAAKIYNDKKKAVKNEKDLTGADLKLLLSSSFKKLPEYLTTTERCHGTFGQFSEHPFDFVIGSVNDEDTDRFFLCGLEIKGDTDNYTRLPRQMSAYLFVFDAVYLVLHKKEKPDWLPDGVGVIRVFENGEAFIEETAHDYDPIGVSSMYEWESLFAQNGIKIKPKRMQKTLGIINGVRKNILFNRFFATSGGWNAPKKHFWPFTDEQKGILLGFDIPEHLKLLEKDLKDIEKRAALLRSSMGGNK